MRSRISKKFHIETKAKDLIEPEEIFLDSQKEEKEIVEGKIEVPLRESVFRLLSFSVAVVFLGLLVRLVSFQTLYHPDYSEAAKQNAFRARPIQAPRGIMYDRNGRALVENIPQIDVYLDIRQSQRAGYLESDIAFLNSVLEGQPGFKPLSLDGTLSQESLGVVRIAWAVEEKRIAVLRARDETELKSGVRVENIYRRKYLDPEAFSHLVGYTGLVSKTELASRDELFLYDTIGKSGVEVQYDTVLRGTNGVILTTVNAKGEIEQEVKSRDPQAGGSLTLTIDADLQRILYESLERHAKRVGSGRAAAVAIDPRDGSILALVSIPGVDTNLLSSGITPEEFEKIKSDPRKPLFSRALSGMYPPGSTIKPFVALAALEENVITPLKQIYAASSISVPNVYNPDIVYTFPDWKEHGWVNMTKAIAVSSNVYFYHVGGGYGGITGLGIEKLGMWFRRFGFGEDLGVDLPGEGKGLIPTPQWKKEAKNEEWFIGDTYHVSIGQGDILVTPLQLALASSIFANDGTLWKPHVLFTDDGNGSDAVSSITTRVGERANRDAVRRGLREAVLSGSSKALRDLAVEVAGKTGTAQSGGEKRAHAWWSGFAPYREPEIVLTVLIENGGEGSSVAVPVAREVLEWYFSR